MFEKINDDIKTAMKAREKERLDALRMLKSAFIENKTAKKPKAEADVAIAHVKKLKDSLESYPDGSPEAQKILSEIDHLSEYVPKAMSKDDVENLVKSVIAENSEANFGVIMKAISPQIKGRFDGRLASEIVKTLLG